MLPTNRRVKKELFPEIMKKGLFFYGESLYLKILDRKDNKISLFSFVVPAKIVKTAVKRHQIKRKITATVEKVLLKVTPGYSVLVFVKKISSTKDQLEKEMLDLLTKSRVLK